MNEFLSALANAFKMHEGWYAGSRSCRNKNPGNLRAGPPHDSQGFTIFTSYEAGFAALIYDLKTKITGGSKHIDYSKSPTFLTLLEVFAPSTDNNDPVQYANAVIKALPQYDLALDTPLAEIAKKYVSAEFVPKKLVLS